MGGLIVVAVAAFVFFKAIRKGGSLRIVMASLFLGFGLLLAGGGLYLQYLADIAA